MSDNQQHSRRRVSYTQLLNLWEFLNSHREVAIGYNKSAQARDHSKRMWDRVASILNSIGEGATKTGTEWSKYWVDLKAKLKRKNRLNRDARSGTGGGPSTEQPLTEMDLKFLSILGEDYGSGLPGVQVIPVIAEEIQPWQPADSQPSTSTDENPVYLDVNFDDSNNQHQSSSLVGDPVLILEQEVLNTEPQIESPSPAVAPSTPVPPVSPANVPPRPGTAAGSSATIQQRRRQLRQKRMTAGEARERLVSAAETRAQSEAANSASLQQALTLLNELVAVLRRIERKMPGEDPRVE
ncbi:hypothetical protein evm_014082 [Chilo suppressalis]|nr:hypothetical protein evm_014082 [Chilo suppressalis]